MNQQPLDDKDINDDREETSSQPEQDEILFPFTCPITKLIFLNPVILSDGYTYERDHALKILAGQNPISYFTHEPLDKNIILPNRALKDAIEIFLKRHPEYQSQVYQINPILNLIEESLNKTDVELNQKLIDLIHQYPNHYQNSDIPTVNSFLTSAYYNLNFATFFIILKRFNNDLLKEYAVELMSSPFENAKYRNVPNIFYALCFSNLPEFFEDAVNILTVEKSKEYFKQPMATYGNVFQIYWISRYYELGRSIINLYELEERMELLQAQLTMFNQNKEIHYPSLLDYMLIHNVDDNNLHQTIELLKKSDIELPERLLSLPCSHTLKLDKVSLFQYICIRWDNLGNLKYLATSCSSKFLIDAIGKAMIQGRIESNLVNFQFVCNRGEVGMMLLDLIREKAADVLLSRWCVSYPDNGVFVANAIHYFYLTGKTKFIEELLKHNFLTDTQVQNAKNIQPHYDWLSLLHSLTVTQMSLDSLNFCIERFEIKDAQKILLSFLNYTNNAKHNCITLAITQFKNSIQHLQFIERLLAFLGHKFQESLKQYKQNYTLIFDLLFKYKYVPLTILILKHIKDVDLLAEIYQELIGRYQNNSDKIRNHFLLLVIINIFDSFANQQRVPYYYDLYRALLSTTTQRLQFDLSSQDLPIGIEYKITHSHIKCIVHYACIAKQFSLLKKLINSFTKEELKDAFKQKVLGDKHYKNLLHYSLEVFSEESISQLLELYDKEIVKEQVLETVTDEGLPLILFAWLKSTFDNAKLLNERVSPQVKANIYGKEIQYLNVKYANIINCLFALKMDDKAIFLLAQLSCEDHNNLLCPWIDRLQDKDALPIMYTNAICFFFKTRRAQVLHKILELKILSEEHIKIAFMQIHSNNDLFNYLLESINNGIVLFFKIGLSCLDAEAAKQMLLTTIIKKKNDVQQNMVTYILMKIHTLSIAQRIQMIGIAKQYLNDQIDEALSCPYSAHENILTMLTHFNNDILNKYVIELFRNATHLNSLFENYYTHKLPESVAKDKVVNMIQIQLLQLTSKRRALLPPVVPLSNVGQTSTMVSFNSTEQQLLFRDLSISQMLQKIHAGIDYYLRAKNDSLTFWEKKQSDELPKANAYKKLLNQYANNPKAVCLIALVLFFYDCESSLVESIDVEFTQPKLELVHKLKEYVYQNGTTSQTEEDFKQVIEYVNDLSSVFPSLSVHSNNNQISIVKNTLPGTHR